MNTSIEEYIKTHMPLGQRPLKRNPVEVDMEEAWGAVNTIGKYLTPDFVIDNDNRKAYTDVLRWCIGKEGNLDPNKGLYLYGNTGTGKTMMMAIIRILCNYYRAGFTYADRGSYLIDKTARADEICDDYAEEGELSQWVKYPSLCINDLGSEPAETVYMGNRRRVLRSILEQRADRADRMTIITSNFPPDSDDFVQMYGHRVRSRIQQMCNVVFLDGPDRRNN